MRVPVLSLLLWLSAVLAQATAILPLAEVRPGQRGVFRTVVSGTAVEDFPFEVVGVARNFVGPGQHAILARALDERSLAMGPVQGMSGSPAYVDGQLIGAYAYGYPWAKDQTVFGIQPIEQMLPLLDLPAAPAAAGAPPPTADTRWQWRAAGLSAATLAAFAEPLSRAGLHLQAGGGGGTAADDGAFPLEAGSAVAAVLLTGDFSIAGTGTVTWRGDDRLLAFGHPMLQLGDVAMPLAGAEILTVIQSAESSFKLSNTGPVVGTLEQDRLTGIRGRLGPVPPMTALHYVVQSPAGRREFRAQAWRHPAYSPLLSGVSLLEALTLSVGAGERQTVTLRGEVRVAGPGGAPLAPIPVRQMASGPGAEFALALDLYGRLLELGQHPFEPATLESLTLEAVAEPAWRAYGLRAVQALTTRAGPGGEIELELGLNTFEQLPVARRVRLPVPDWLAADERVTVWVADAEQADRLDGVVGSPDLTLAATAANLARRRAADAVYVKLLRPANGFLVDGQALPGLPPSVQAHLTAPANQAVRARAEWETLAEVAVPLDGPFTGNFRLVFVLD